MELTSTASFKDIDIDKMLEHTTMDDFMRGLYLTQDKEMADTQKPNVMAALMTGAGLEEMNEKFNRPDLQFEDREAVEEAQSDALRQKALVSLRERRLRLK